MKKKLILLALVGLGIALFYVFDLGQYLSLESLKANRDRLDSVYRENALGMVLGFIGIYFVVVALSLPGATILTLTGGAIFGSVTGALIVNVGATLGATAAFLVARFILRDWVERKFGDKLEPINKGFSENAISYLLFLRLVPLFPFFLVNLVSGLTKVRLPVYFFGTMFGILPGSLVYANAGSNLARIDSLSDIASPGVLFALILLGVFALIPTLYHRYKNKKIQPSAV
ncbi:dihydrolipoamide dehydrogenase [Candidatus Nitromaritima sp. SCGC AAA799-A02]|nr:dihydrolipoamide dehydrogenase [Candidatus Nitromaritima sp. SCGC AAA799-C22]KMP12743.1 dihydrolipoamide dehydrogenase [Candidatus Nitromaritima sp. SCGC AAA799-A02]